MPGHRAQHGALALLALGLLLGPACADATQAEGPGRDTDPLTEWREAARGNISQWRTSLLQRTMQAYRSSHHELGQDSKPTDIAAPFITCPPPGQLSYVGGKYLCSAGDLAAPCLVLSVGSSGSHVFQEEMLANTPCQVATFDCTSNVTINHERHIFYDKCIGSPDAAAVDPSVVTWKQAMELLRQFKAEVVRVEGPRAWDALYWLPRDLRYVLPRQVVVTVQASSQASYALQLSSMALPPQHIDGGAVTPLLIMHFANMGYGLASRDEYPASNSTDLLLVRATLHRVLRSTHAAHDSSAGSAAIDAATTGGLAATAQPLPGAVASTGSMHAQVQPSHGSSVLVPGPMVAPPLAGHYQCYNRSKAVREVLRRFRQFYPECPIYMVNDGGARSLADVAREFRANYTYSDNTGVAGNTFLPTAAAMVAWMQRIISSAATADWVILLEDDVHIRKEIALHALRYDVNGHNPSTRLPDPVVALIEQVTNRTLPDRSYGGGGGAIFRGAFLRAMARLGQWQALTAQLKELYEGAVPSDQLLSALVYLHGGTIGPYPGFLEKWEPDYDVRLASGAIEVTHQDKGWYDRRRRLMRR